MTELERMVFAAAMIAGANPKVGRPWGDVEHGARAVAALRLEVRSWNGDSKTPAGRVMVELLDEIQ